MWQWNGRVEQATSLLRVQCHNYRYRRLRFSSDADNVRLTNVCIIIITSPRHAAPETLGNTNSILHVSGEIQASRQLIGQLEMQISKCADKWMTNIRPTTEE